MVIVFHIYLFIDFGCCFVIINTRSMIICNRLQSSFGIIIILQNYSSMFLRESSSIFYFNFSSSWYVFPLHVQYLFSMNTLAWNFYDTMKQCLSSYNFYYTMICDLVLFGHSHTMQIRWLTMGYIISILW